MKKNIISAGDFNLFFDQKLESAGENSILKKLAVSKLIKLKESLNLELEILNPKHLLFGNVISLEFCREDLTIFSNNMQELAKNVKTLNALSMDHSPLFCSFLKL